MSIFKCKMCGGNIEFEQGASVGTCDHCGTKQTLPKLDDDKRANLYDRANHFRRNNEYDKAAAIYEQILNEDGTDAEAYWSLVLCRYGVEYVEDPATKRRVPTVNRAQFTSVFADEDYRSAINNADAYQKGIYEAEAKAIDEIQKGILAISQKEEPFDVFICYKETDNNGRRTPDSVLATELYHQLTQEGFKVFFSRITLEDKLGTAYEPYIFAALNSAKMMVVLGTKPEYFNAVWVKNEWSRYLALVKKSGGKKMLIPAYKDMDPYDLPEEFSHLQAQDMSKLGFMQDLIRGIKKIIGADEPKAAVKETVVIGAANVNVAPLLKRAFMFLEDGNWEKADEYCEKVLDQDPENAHAYLGKLMVELRVRNKESLIECNSSFKSYDNYNKIMRFGDSALKEEISSYIDIINDRRFETLYDCAVRALSKAQTEEEYKSVAELFAEISGYKDSDALFERCTKEANVTKERKVTKETKDKVINLDKGQPIVDGKGITEHISEYMFGKYPTSKDGEISPIEWIVLKREGQCALLLSKYALDCKPYNNTRANVTWETCTLREWLNNSFLSSAFSESELNRIKNTEVSAEANPIYNKTPSGNDTVDKVFLMSINQIYDYFDTDFTRMCTPTEYAVSNGCWSTNKYSGSAEKCWWWLRSPGGKAKYAAGVDSAGCVFEGGGKVDYINGGVRPAMWINLG